MAPAREEHAHEGGFVQHPVRGATGCSLRLAEVENCRFAGAGKDVLVSLVASFANL